MRWKPAAGALVILLVLATAVVVPPVVAGFGALDAANAAMQARAYRAAAASYARSMQLLPWRTDLPEKAGNAEFAAGRYPAAIDMLRRAADRSALSSRGWNELGASYWRTGDRQAALSSWLSGSRLYPQDTALLDQLAGAYQQMGDYGLESAALRSRLQLADDAAAEYRLGLLLLVDDTTSAVEYLGSAASLDSRFASASNTLRAAAQQALQADPSRGDILLGRGLALVQEWKLAQVAFERAAALDPANAQAWAWLGEAMQQTGHGGSAELDRALALDPGDSTVHILRGLYFRRQGQIPKAVSEYNRAAALDPNNPAIQVSLGEAQAANGDLVAAFNAYQQATVLAPGDATYWRLLALFCADRSVQVFEVGVPAAQRATVLAPADPQAMDALGWAYLQAGYLEQAQAALAAAAKAGPNLAYPHVHLAVLYLRLGEDSQSLAELKLVLRAEPDGPAADTARQLLKQYFPSESPSP